MTGSTTVRSVGELVSARAILAIQDGNHGGTHPKASEYVTEGIPFVMASDIRDGRIDLVGAKRLPKVRTDRLRIGFARPGDVLLTHKGTVGEVAIVPNVEDYVMLTPQVTYYRTDGTKLDHRYLAFALRSPFIRAQLESISAQSTRPYVSISTQRHLSIPWHQIDTQRRIAGILSAYDDLIENNERRIAILEEMARRIFREWFVDFRFPGHEAVRMVDTEAGRIPEGWRIDAFTEVADVLSGGTPRKDRADFWGGAIPFFTPRDAPAHAWATTSDALITMAGLEACSSLLYPPRTVFVTARGTVGRLALAAEPMAMNQSCYALRGRGFAQFFLLEFTRSAVDRLKTMSTGAVFDTIIVDTFRRLFMTVPPRELASAYDTIVEPHFEAARSFIVANERLRVSRDLLLPRLISGDLTVSTAERELETAA